jgi:hypothetical protein
MGARFKIPCENGQMVDVEVTSDLGITFHDYDIEYDLGLLEFNYPETICAHVVNSWKASPMMFICGSGLFSIRGLGIVSCRLAKEALEIIALEGEQFSCFDEASKLIDVSLKNWYPKTTAIKGLHHARQAMIQCWNTEIRERRGDYKTTPSMPSFASQKVVEAAEYCADFVTHFWSTMELTAGFEHYPYHPCTIAESTKLAIAEVRYRKISEERARFFGVSFKELLDHPPDDLADLLYGIELDQARVAVEVLEIIT